MGAVTSASTKIDSVSELYPKIFPLHGVKLSYITEFIKSHGGRAAFEGWTSDDVCKKIFVRETERLKCSYVDLLRAAKHPAYTREGRADVFISHAWKYIFLDLVDTLLHHFSTTQQPDIVVWFDGICINQHTVSEWWSTASTYEGIREIGYTVMVLSPWQDPIPLKRAWCLYELYCTHKSKSKFEVALGEVGQRQLIETLKSTNSITALNKMLAEIDVGKSKAEKESDRISIFETVERESVAFLN